MNHLNEYSQKRNFKKTPEPTAKVKASKTKKRMFVVQEHHASHLHYDFRLELDGVLKSWAVPKGPSPLPSEKRLAVQVEDHPLKYGSFEGNIPDDEYGGGEVLIWDNGTWEPDGDPHFMLKKGHLEFTLKGKRMRGKWMLIRTHGLGGNKANWLLMKRSDEYAGDTTQFRPIKAYGSKREKKATTATDPFPKFIEPMLPLLVDTPPVGDEWVHEMKFDGYRIQARIQKQKVSLITRSGQDWTDEYESIVQSLKKLTLKNKYI